LASSSSDYTGPRVLNKTFDLLDNTDINVPEESIIGSQEDEYTERESKRRLECITSCTQRFIDQEGSFCQENTHIEETWKNDGGVQFSQTEDIGEIRIANSGRVSVNLKQVEMSGTRPEEEIERMNMIPEKVNLEGGQELVLSPKRKPKLVEHSPPRRTSPMCRSFNAPIITVTSATSLESEANEVFIIFLYISSQQIFPHNDINLFHVIQ
jgi:hypothetical protein